MYCWLGQSCQIFRLKVRARHRLIEIEALHHAHIHILEHLELLARLYTFNAHTHTKRLGKLTEDSVIDNSALKQALGWDRMPVAAEDGLRLTLASFRE